MSALKKGMSKKPPTSLDLQKYKAWNPRSGEPANVEYGSGLSGHFKRYIPTIRVVSAVAFILGAGYLVIVKPMKDIKKWQSVQRENREGIDQEAIQPGGMRVWSDPFKR